MTTEAVTDPEPNRGNQRESTLTSLSWTCPWVQLTEEQMLASRLFIWWVRRPQATQRFQTGKQHSLFGVETRAEGFLSSFPLFPSFSWMENPRMRKVVCFSPQCLTKSIGQNQQWELENANPSWNLPWNGFKLLLILPRSFRPLLEENTTCYVSEPLDPMVHR